MIISRYVIWFFLYSFIGWIWETIFCTAKSRQWANRGFLYGPICPIYGAGGVVIQLLMGLLTSLTGFESASDFSVWQVFLFSFIVCTVLEYVTHWLLETFFHAYWWDYTNMPLNINGRICLPASCAFGLAGVALVYLLMPAMENFAAAVPPLLVEALSLVLIFLLSMDITLTISALSGFERSVAAMDEKITQHMEQFVASLPGGQTGSQAAMATEREAFERKSMNELLENMHASYRSSIQRVKSFQPRRPSKKSAGRPELPDLKDYLDQHLQTERIDQLRIQFKEHMTLEREKARQRKQEQKKQQKKRKK